MRDGHCDWLENARSANGWGELEHRYHRGTARESSGWRSRKQRDVVCDPFPSLTAERTPPSTQGADVLRSCATVMLVRIASLFHVAWSISSHQKLSRACDGGLGENETPSKISHLVGVQSNHSR